MQLNEHESAQLAELVNLPGFQLLMGVFRDFEDGVAAEVATAKTAFDMNKAARLYQCVRFVREFLQVRPAMALRELEQLKQQQLALDGMPTNFEDIWRGRFAPDTEPIQ